MLAHDVKNAYIAYRIEKKACKERLEFLTRTIKEMESRYRIKPEFKK